MRDVIRIIRPLSSLAGAVTVVVGGWLAGGLTLDLVWPSVLAAAGISAAIGVANVVNDITDVAADSINKPGRPLTSGRLSVAAAWTVAAVLAAAALLLAGLAAARLTAAMAVLLAVATGYSFWLKDTVVVGNLTVALCASVPVPFGAAIVGAFPARVWVGAGLVFLFMLTNEVLKTIEDSEADAKAGLHTVATVHGVPASVRLLRACVALLTAGGLAAAVASSRPLLYAAVALVSFVVPSWVAVLMLGMAPAPGSMKRSVYLMRISWALGLTALWLLR